MLRRAAASSFVIFLCSLGPAASAAPPPAKAVAPAAKTPAIAAGSWSGTLHIPGMKLEVKFDLSRDGGGWKGSFDVPQQGIKAFSLFDIEVEGDVVSFSLKDVPGNAGFKGKLSADGGKLVGDFTQGGMPLPLSLERRPDTARAASDALAGFPDLVRKVLADWKAPGVAVAIVRDGKVVLAEGYGLRDVKKKLPVTRDTLFAIGSCTKAFTSLLLGILVDDGKLDWDKPVATWLPSFRLKDRFAAQHATPRDLTTHRIGLPRHELVWYGSTLSRKELFDRLQYLEPNEDFRAAWQYQNLMYMTAGYLAGEVAGVTWEELIRRRIFKPLGMKTATLSIADSKKSRDYALPYGEVEKKTEEIPFRAIDAIGPAGSINASAAEMARWLQLQLGGGKVGDVHLVSEATLNETHRPQMIDARLASPEDKEIFHVGHAMGWGVAIYRGHRMVEHGGAIDGFTASVTLLPDEGVGVVVLTNKDGSPVPTIVAHAAVDLLLGLPAVDWSARLLTRAAAGEKAIDAAQQKAELERRPNAAPAHALDEYTGVYEHPAYGAIEVARKSEALEAIFHGIPMGLEHWHYEIFRAHPRDKRMAEKKLYVQFLTNTAGDVDRLSTPLEDAVPEIVFSKQPPARLSDPKFVRSLAGTYVIEAVGAKLTVAVRGDRTLTLTVPGRPIYELVPYRGNEYRLKGLTGFSIRFVLDAKGWPTEIQSIQPNGVFTAKRT